MSSPQHCLAMADEADRLAGIVSYERDKDRLRAQAAAWRRMAGSLQSPPPAAAEPISGEPRRPSGVAGWLNRRRA